MSDVNHVTLATRISTVHKFTHALLSSVLCGGEW